MADALGSRRRGGTRLPDAPGWRVVERPQQRAPLEQLQPAPSCSAGRVNPLLPWVAGSLMSLMVLALAAPDGFWSALRGDPLAALDAAGGDRSEPMPAAVATPANVAPTDTAAMGPPLARRAAPRVTALPGRPPPSALRGDVTAESARPTDDEAPARTPPAAAPLAPGTAALSRPPGAEAAWRVPLPALRPDLDGALEVRLAAAFARGDQLRSPIALIGLRDGASGSAPAAASRTRVFIHHAAAHPGDAVVAVRLADFLRRRGFEVGAIRPVQMPIRQASLRYFFERDGDDSRRLLEELGWFFKSEPQRAPDRASDFTHYRPLPRPGNIEVWLPTS